MEACYLMWVCQWERHVTSGSYCTVSAWQVHLNLGGPASTHGWSCSRDHKSWGLMMWCGDAAIEGLPITTDRRKGSGLVIGDQPTLEKWQRTQLTAHTSQINTSY